MLMIGFQAFLGTIACYSPSSAPTCTSYLEWLTGIFVALSLALVACIRGLIRRKFGRLLKTVIVGMALLLGGLALYFVWLDWFMPRDMM